MLNYASDEFNNSSTVMDSDLDMPANSDSDGGENDQEVMAEIETWLGTLSWTWQRWKARTGPGWTWSNGIEVRQEPGNHPAKAVQQAHILLHVSQIPPLHPPPFMSQMDYEVACLAKLAFESLVVGLIKIPIEVQLDWLQLWSWSQFFCSPHLEKTDTIQSCPVFLKD